MMAQERFNGVGEGAAAEKRRRLGFFNKFEMGNGWGGVLS